MVSSKRSPARAGSSGTSEPDRMISPALNGMPKAPRVLASQATAVNGLPCTAEPRPSLRGSAFLNTRMRKFGRSSSRGSTLLSPNTNTPQEALSATVSWMRMRQS
ncbi:hypothetical protein D3C87_1955470 [compost metagenome]